MFNLETHININQSTEGSALSTSSNLSAPHSNMKNRTLKRFHPTAALSYVSITVLILSILSVGYTSNQQQNTVFGAVSALAEEDASSIDQAAAATLAADVAKSTSISVEPNVANLSTSLNARVALAQSNQDFASKPQMMSDALKNALRTYKVEKGDTLKEIAASHGVSVQTVKWANNLSGDTVGVGRELRIPTIDGVIYTIAAGDTVKSLATKYKVSESRITSFNDTELSGLKVGRQIIIPGGVLPKDERPGYVAESTGGTSYGGGGSASSSPVTQTTVPFEASYTTSYPFGWCTYYAAKTGAPGNWGNANTWDNYAAATPGWTVSKTPRAGAIAQRDWGGGGMGHVAIVDAVSADGTMIKYSDMNGIAGWGAVGNSGWTSPSQFENFIYRE